MTRIGILSDTRLRAADPALTQALARVFAGVDMILHAGDIIKLDRVELPGSPGHPRLAGNMYGPEVAA